MKVFRIVVCEWSSLFSKHFLILSDVTSFFMTVLLDLLTKLLLKTDVVPTIFCHNFQTVRKKRLFTIRRENNVAKQQARLFSTAFKYWFLKPKVKKSRSQNRFTG